MPVTQVNERFFSDLEEIQRFKEIVEPSSYQQAPRDWSVVITDVRGSTKAIERGRYKDVNALGVSSIIGLKNAVQDVELPYVFGGDGATLLVPDSRREAVLVALGGLRRLACDAFELGLRCGIVSVGELLDAGAEVRVARFRSSPHVVLAMLMGQGVAVAEAWIKDEQLGSRYEAPTVDNADVNLEGFECRWHPVKNRRGTMVSLLIQAVGAPARYPEIYRAVLDELEQGLGESNSCPISERGLSLQGLFGDFSVEGRVRSGVASGPLHDDAVAFARKKSLIGKTLDLTGLEAGGFRAATYKSEFVQNCDFRKFDETLRMVLDLSSRQLDLVVSVLEQHQARGELVFGVHLSKTALVTCFVRSFDGDHVHFIDGADGGYALAAKQLKTKLRSNPQANVQR